MLQQYKAIKFSSANQRLIDSMNTIIEDYTAQGYRLTVRQLYYQLVASATIENTERSYKRITSIVNDARLAGLIDWDAIEDRTRAFIRRGRWESAQEIVGQCAKQFHMDMWATQERRPFVIIEKEALVGVLEGVCREFDTPLLAARGYPSGTVLREFCLSDIQSNPGQWPVIIHLGDHDPSGIDMSRDLTERIELFAEGEVSFRRIALNMKQIEERKPPPNPAKTTDSRFESYRERFGDDSWELDALPPQYLSELVKKEIESLIQWEPWEARLDEIDEEREKIAQAAKEL